MRYPVTTGNPVRDAERWMEYNDALAAQHDAKVEGWIAQIWEEAIVPLSAERWAWDYECLVNDEPDILEAAAHARRSGDMEYLGRMVMARLDAWVKKTAEHMASEVGK